MRVRDTDPTAASHATDSQQAAAWSQIQPGPHDVRLVVADMDGTLLTDDGAVPESFWPLLESMRARDITFVPASGRQYATLAALFAGVEGLSYIAENGNLVMHDGEPLASSSVDGATVQQVIRAARVAARTRDLGLVVCGLDSAYVERADRPFIDEAGKYYARLAVVDDLTEVVDSVLKLAVYDFADSEAAYRLAFESFAEEHQVVLSGEHWLDIMRRGVDKGRAVRALQRELGISPAQTVAFGDYLNDLQMLEAADWSFAMGNAHPDIRAAARYLAPTNGEDGVVEVLSHLLAR